MSLFLSKAKYFFITLALLIAPLMDAHVMPELFKQAGAGWSYDSIFAIVLRFGLAIAAVTYATRQYYTPAERFNRVRRQSFTEALKSKLDEFNDKIQAEHNISSGNRKARVFASIWESSRISIGKLVEIHFLSLIYRTGGDNIPRVRLKAVRFLNSDRFTWAQGACCNAIITQNTVFRDGSVVSSAEGLKAVDAQLERIRYWAIPTRSLAHLGSPEAVISRPVFDPERDFKTVGCVTLSTASTSVSDFVNSQQGRSSRKNLLVFLEGACAFSQRWLD